MKQNTNPQSDRNETDRQKLDWLAFQFVSGELADGDAAAFEARLAHDEAACSAVADAVLLCESVRTVFTGDECEVCRDPVTHCTPVKPSTSAVRRRRVAVAVTGLVAMLLFVVLTLPWLGGSFDNGIAQHDRKAPAADMKDSASTRTHEAEEMLRLWADPDNAPLMVEEPADVRPANDDLDSLVADIPDWLMVAVQAEAGLFVPESAERVKEN